MAEPTPAAAAAPDAETFNFKRAISRLVQLNGSDLLLKVGRPPTVRVNGELQSLPMQALRPEDLKQLAEQIMTPRQVKEFAEKKEADFAIGVPGVGRFRTNIYQQRGTLAFAFRAIPYEVKTIDELHLPKFTGGAPDGSDEIDRTALVLAGPDRSIRALESQLVAKVLDDTQWNISRAASILGINRTTLYNKIRLYELGKRPLRAKVIV